MAYTTSEIHSFQAETKNLMDLMIHSLYTNKDIFLRELISNASDALDRLRFAVLTNPQLLESDDRFEIRLEVDRPSRTLTVSDTGIGMGRDEVLRNIGTIALSGTREIRDQIPQESLTQHLAHMIGHFGVGFYSAFMVADRVDLLTRKAGEQAATHWQSDGNGVFTIREDDKASRGTVIRLHLKAEDPENGVADFTDPWKLEEIVKKYSDFIAYPIRLRQPNEELARDGSPIPFEPSANAITDDRVLNSMKPLWTLPPTDIQESDSRDFYKRLCHDQEAPLKTLTFKAEGRHEFQALLFIPSRAASDLYYHAPDVGLRLFANRVLIIDKCPELLPRYLRFVRGVVDSTDMPLNISRQRLQEDIHISRIREWLTKKILDALSDMYRVNPEQYLGLWREFGRAIKEGVASDWANRDRILPLLLFASSNDDSALTTLEDYVARMKSTQTNIVYLSGENRELLERSPHLEATRENGHEVLFLTDPVDELMLQHLTQFHGKPLKSAAKDVFKSNGSEDDNNNLRIEEKEYSVLLQFLKDTLQEQVKRVQLSKRLTKSPVCLIVDAYENSPWMDRMLLKGKESGVTSKRILELNPKHPLIVGMNRRLIEGTQDATLVQGAHLLFNLALIAEGSNISDPVAFSETVTKLLQKFIG